MQTKAAILYDINSDLKVEKLSLSNPKTGEVLVQMGAAGICHSDFHVISGQASQKMPCVLGHEGAGKVISVGENVTRVSQGDHVILSWLPYSELGSIPYKPKRIKFDFTKPSGPRSSIWDLNKLCSL